MAPSIRNAPPLTAHADVVRHEAPAFVGVPVEAEREVVFSTAPHLPVIQFDLAVSKRELRDAVRLAVGMALNTPLR